MTSKAGLANTCRAGQQDAAASKKPLTAEHDVQGWDTAGNSLDGCLVLQLERRDRQDGDATLVNQERELIGGVGRASILDNPQAAR